MTEKVTAIVLGRVRHSDKLDIISLYTDLYGRVSVTSSVGTSASARRRAALLMPLSVVRGDMVYNSVRSIQTFKNTEPAMLHPAIYSDPVKSAVALFVSEFLSKVLRESEPNAYTFSFIVNSLRWLNESDHPENFHLVFLAQMSHYLGFYPDVTGYSPDAIFDMRAGTFTDFQPLHRDVLEGEDARMVVMLSRLTYGVGERIRFSGKNRSRILNGMLHYYGLHIPGAGGMKTPDVLHALFS